MTDRNHGLTIRQRHYYYRWARQLFERGSVYRPGLSPIDYAIVTMESIVWKLSLCRNSPELEHIAEPSNYS